MLGENHSLTNEFPHKRQQIQKLIDSNSTFANDTKRYHELDNEIRSLELNNAPIDDDDALHQMKHQRATLKDLLYSQLIRT